MPGNFVINICVSFQYRLRYREVKQHCCLTSLLHLAKDLILMIIGQVNMYSSSLSIQIAVMELCFFAFLEMTFLAIITFVTYKVI